MDDDAAAERMATSSEAMMLAREWESFAMLGSQVLGPKTAPQYMVVVAIDGRLNRTNIRRRYVIAMSPDDAITFGEGVIHSAKVAKRT
jgi:hypothetical protein